MEGTLVSKSHNINILGVYHEQVRMETHKKQQQQQQPALLN